MRKAFVPAVGFADARLQRNGRCHESEVFAAFRRDLARYRAPEAVSDEQLRGFVRNWAAGATRSSTGYLKGVSVAASALLLPVYTRHDSTAPAGVSVKSPCSSCLFSLSHPVRGMTKVQCCICHWGVPWLQGWIRSAGSWWAAPAQSRQQQRQREMLKARAAKMRQQAEKQQRRRADE